VSNLFGSATAITAALWLLPHWLDAQPPRIEWIFGFAGICFTGAACLALLASEPAETYPSPRTSWKRRIIEGWAAMRRNRSFARLCAASALSGCSMVLFPHYQALGRTGSTWQASELVLWIVVQNLVTGLFSMLVGPIADSRGNRVAVRLSLLLLVTLPLTALGLAHLGDAGRRFYFVVFGLLGFFPVTARLLNHYTLEISAPGDHPRFLSMINACQAAPALLAPGVGAAIDWFGLESVFLAVAAFNVLGWLLTWRLDEPRKAIP
jgi:predicted MFS family arabinose efflux permease